MDELIDKLEDDSPMTCDCCENETDTVFNVYVVPDIGEKWVCPICFVLLTDHDDDRLPRAH